MNNGTRQNSVFYQGWKTNLLLVSYNICMPQEKFLKLAESATTHFVVLYNIHDESNLF